ncbi:MYXO-CTERM sorting domain-containing protein [Sorangium sp. So ce131]|uniref:MYXO-CTERM sorting domain-containing protein n=1 Tax=Sorangium sp. So ce131 TaxID=3133282 RepID=UPI003F61607A
MPHSAFLNFSRAARAALPLALSLAPAAWPALASAQVRQPTGEVMPQPVGENELGLVRGRGFPEDAVTLEGLFMYRGETIDPVDDASIEPGVFSPLCGFTGELVLRGGGCRVAFGWYNATASGMRPPDNQIYELIPANPSEAFNCEDGDFCPLATMMTTQVGQHDWTPRSFSAEDIRQDPRYAGGLVGFALIGSPSTLCTQTKFSQAELNTQCTNCTPAQPWVTTLIYTSTKTPDAFYVAFEDLPVTPTSWRGSGGSTNDGDFNDFVYYITGVTCQGGGEVCDTGQPGACAVGRTGCATDGEVACHAVLEPGEQAERCDNIDNDCDGEVDNAEGLCAEGLVCNRGNCVPYCGRGEVVCDAGLVCDEGLCVEAACVGVACEGGEICVGGLCVGGCDGVVCPGNQECQLGRCVDLCASVECDEGMVCERGICQSNCGCRTCGAGKECADSGHCLDAGCDGVTCPAGQLCRAGACVDACAGVVCPGNAPCVNGACGEPVLSMSTSAASGGTIDEDIGLGDDNGNPTSPAGGAGGGGDTSELKPDSSCACRAGATSDGAPARLGLLGLGFLLLAGRRRRARGRA